MKPVSGERAPEASMSRSESSRGGSWIVSSPSTPSGRSPSRSTSSPPCGAIRWASAVAVTSNTHLAEEEPELLELAEHPVRALLGRGRLGIDDELRAGRRLIRVGDAGELLDLAGERLLVQPFHIPRRAGLHRGFDVDLDERPEFLDHVPRLAPRGFVGRNRGDEDGGAVPGQPRGDPADALDVRVPVLLRETESFGEVGAHDVAVQVFDEPPDVLEPTPDELGDRRLARAREPREPEREPAPHSLFSKWMPHSNLSEPAQRPARSSSSGRVGRVHGMQPIERKPTSWSGLYGISLTVM